MPLCLALTGINLGYWILLFSRLGMDGNRTERQSNVNKPVSVIVCARDEEENLGRNLPRILAQKYPQYELIVIDDNSSDGTGAVLKELGRKHGRLRHFRLGPRPDKGKKQPLKEGIHRAENDLLLLTDADCRPATDHWMLHMASAAPGRSFVLAYGAYGKRPGLLNLLVRFECAMSGIQYLSYALAGFPYMGVGRNLMYRKSEFLLTDQFARHDKLLSGDDDIHINRYARGNNTAVVLHPDARTISVPPERWSAFLRQKRRHYSTAGHYRLITKIALALYQVSFLGFYICLLWAILADPVFAWKIYVIRMAVAWPLFALSAYRLKEGGLAWIFPLLEPVLAVLLVILSPSLIRRQHEW